MHNKYGFQICSGHKIKILMEMIEKRVYENKHIQKRDNVIIFQFNEYENKTFGKYKKIQNNGVINLFV